MVLLLTMWKSALPTASGSPAPRRPSLPTLALPSNQAVFSCLGDVEDGGLRRGCGRVRLGVRAGHGHAAERDRDHGGEQSDESVQRCVPPGAWVAIRRSMTRAACDQFATRGTVLPVPRGHVARAGEVGPLADEPRNRLPLSHRPKSWDVVGSTNGF